MSVRTVRPCIVAAILGGLGAIAVSTHAVAEPAGNVDLNAFRPAMDSRGYLTVNASQVLGDKEGSFGLGRLAWGPSPLKLDGMGTTYSVDDMTGATLIGAFGIHVGPAELEF